MQPEPAPRRHDLLQPTAPGWRRLLDSGIGAAHQALLARGAASGWRLVARRRMPPDPPGMIPVGLPLPPSAGKPRLAWALAPAEIERIDPPPGLAEAMAFAPPHWRRTATELLRLGAASGIVPRVFGSLAWSALTGLDYLGPGSDLDLLWPLRTGQDPAPLLRGLILIEPRAPMRLDGEIVLDDGRAVHWRELASGAPELLVKTVERVALAPRSELFA